MNRIGLIKKLAIVSLATLALAVPVVWAQKSRQGGTEQGESRESRGGKRWGNHRGGRDGGMNGMMFRSLNLTDDQKAKMKQIRESFFERNKPLMEELRAKHEELRQASEGATFDEALATERLTAMAGLEAKMMGERFKQKQEMLAILTPEQKTQLEQKEAEFKAKRAARSNDGGSRKGQ